jgi:CHAT domain-containing protein
VRTTGRSITPASWEELLHKLALLPRKSAQIRLLASHPALFTSETVTWLSDSSREQAKIDTSKALRLAELAMIVAGRLKDRAAKALGLRTMGNAFYVSGQSEDAIVYHEKARRLFAKIANRKEVARTLSAAIQPMILTGRYDRALSNVKLARRIFTSLRDNWRLARLDLNTGNIFHRQDRFAEALKWYRRAHRYFFVDPEKDPEAMAVALHNIAMCLVSLNDFRGALAAHQEARSFADNHGMRVLVAQTDYNIAALHYLRGEHSRAIRMLLMALEDCQKTNDQYHVALCRLDLSDIYLQLNLAGPAEEKAKEAAAGFQKLGMGYETGKSLVNLGLALSRQNNHAAALKILAKARRQFIAEKNSAWPFLTDFYQAIILAAQGRHHAAWIRCVAANKFFRTAGIPDKLVLTYLLLAQLQLSTGKLKGAALACSRALALLEKLELPVLACQAKQLMGRIQMAAGNSKEAYKSYQEARHLLEAMRSDLYQEEMKISFMEGRLEIYEGLVELCLQPASGHHSFEEAFQYIEQSKSRSLQEMMSFTESGALFSAQDSEAQNKARDIRAEINWYSRRLSEEQRRASESSGKVRRDLQAALREREHDLLRVSREMTVRDVESGGLLASKSAPLQEIRESLPAESCLVEYFQTQDRLLVATVTHKAVNIVPLAQVSEIKFLVEHLEFQLNKFRLGPDYLNIFGDSLLATTQQHLTQLYNKLFSPIEAGIDGKHLLIIPHGILHRLPFQALFDGARYLIDKFSISYAPSATIHRLCRNRPVNQQGPSLVMGIPDIAAPLILDEATAVAGIVPQSELLLNEKASATALQRKGSQCRLIHIATHGYYRQDSPMFSGIRLGDSILSLYDLYHFKLPVELITLSGCATGVSTVAGGDELLGLVRGLIYAGAKAALLTLWDVQDRSTLQFMTAFYRHFVAGENKAVAVQKAVHDIRGHYPHPYYWAPFSLVGNIFS